jgi:hypothetical protein
MNPALFRLISRAGRASLDELRARSSVNKSVLARDLVTMLQNGAVVLSCNPDASSKEDLSNLSPEALKIVTLVQKTDEADRTELVTADDEMKTWTQAMIAAFDDQRVADCVMVSPTPRGFKLTAA